MLGFGKKDAQPKPIRYEYKTETVFGGWLHGSNGKADKKIREMQGKGWEYVETQTHGMADRLTVVFRRPK